MLGRSAWQAFGYWTQVQLSRSGAASSSSASSVLSGGAAVTENQ